MICEDRTLRRQHDRRVWSPSLIFSVNGTAPISVSLDLGPHCHASTVNSTVGDWPFSCSLKEVFSIRAAVAVLFYHFLLFLKLYEHVNMRLQKFYHPCVQLPCLFVRCWMLSKDLTGIVFPFFGMTQHGPWSSTRRIAYKASTLPSGHGCHWPRS